MYDLNPKRLREIVIAKDVRLSCLFRTLLAFENSSTIPILIPPEYV